MPRRARVVLTQEPHHLTLRGSRRQPVFFDDGDRRVYLALLGEQAGHYGLRLLGYCLMTNHVHLLAIPEGSASMAKTIRHAHGRYAQYLNARMGWTGHVWQCRYYSCLVEERAVGPVMRYVERNPVRAGLVPEAVQYGWSSARAHVGGADGGGLLNLEYWRERWSPADWARCLAEEDPAEETERIRTWTHAGCPLGSEGYVQYWEERLDRGLRPQPAGRPKGGKVAQNAAGV